VPPSKLVPPDSVPSAIIRYDYAILYCIRYDMPTVYLSCSIRLLLSVLILTAQRKVITILAQHFHSLTHSTHSTHHQLIQAELKGSWMEIAKRLPHRSVQSVYRHGIRQLHPFKRGAWSEQETAVLTELVQRMGKKWSAIQTKLNRSADACRDKYREMSDEYVKGRWKDPEMELLKRLVREHLNVDAGTDMKSLGRMVEEQNIQIPWSTISKRIGKRSRLSCFKKWQKMAGLLSASDEVRRRKASDISNPEEINGVGITAAVMAAGAAYSNKRLKTEGGGDGHDEGDEDGHPSTHAAPTAGAAAAMAAAAGALASGTTGNGDVYDEVYNSAKMAEETVEAVDLPDVDGPTVHI
jgi:hypothetical protein